MMPVNTIQFRSQTPNPNIPEVDDVSVEEVNEKKSQLRLIDVRRPDEWVGELGHIAEAELMTLDTLPQRLSELSKDESIVFICRSGARSAQAAAFAKENGFSTVYNMRGGMIDWNNKNFATKDKNGG
jgi:rhodanese-related sulfurtransferase